MRAEAAKIIWPNRREVTTTTIMVFIIFAMIFNTAVGMFTERDVVRAIAEHGAAGAGMKVSQLVSVQQLVSCTSSDTLEHIRHLMTKHHIRHVPVIDNYSLIGVVSMRDIAAEEVVEIAQRVLAQINAR